MEKKNVIILKEKNMKVLNNIDFHSFADSISKAVEARDQYTAGHSDRVAEITLKISEYAGFSKDDQEQFHISAHLHDIGKIGIPDGILLKTGKLTVPEKQVMNEHVIIGYNILKNIRGFEKISEGVLFHHERYDGNGYPYGKKGEEIPILARIISVADTFDAITSNRNYRSARDVKTAYKIITHESGKQLCPEIVSIFSEIYKKEKEFLCKISYQNR